MEKVKVTFLGTSGAVPTANRNHSAIFINYKDQGFLIDCGEGTQRQFKYAKLSAAKVNKILITHWHGDHILGLPGMLQTFLLQDIKNKIEMYGPKKSKSNFENILHLVRRNKELDLTYKEVSGKVLETEDILVESLPMDHTKPSNAYSITLKDKLRLNKEKIKKLNLPNSPLLKKLQEGKDIKHEGKTIKAKDITYKEKGKKITIIMDTRPNANALKLAKDSDLLICEATYTKKEKSFALERKHLIAEETATIAKKAKVKQLIITHITGKYDKKTKPVLDEAKKIFKNTKVANDLDTLEL